MNIPTQILMMEAELVYHTTLFGQRLAILTAGGISVYLLVETVYMYLHLLDAHTAIVQSGSGFSHSLLGHRWSPAVVSASLAALVQSVCLLPLSLLGHRSSSGVLSLSYFYSAELHLSLLVVSSNY